MFAYLAEGVVEVLHASDVHRLCAVNHVPYTRQVQQALLPCARLLLAVEGVLRRAELAGAQAVGEARGLRIRQITSSLQGHVKDNPFRANEYSGIRTWMCVAW